MSDLLEELVHGRAPAIISAGHQVSIGPVHGLYRVPQPRGHGNDIGRVLYERFRHLIHEGARFGVVGGIGFVITDGGTNLLQSPLHGWLKANVIATVAAMIVTYLGSRYWTFRHRERGGMGRETVLFFVLNGMGLGIQLACIGITNYALGRTDQLAANVALLLGICLGTLFRFWSYRRWVWIAPAASPALDPAEFAAEQLSHVPSADTSARCKPAQRQQAVAAKSRPRISDSAVPGSLGGNGST